MLAISNSLFGSVVCFKSSMLYPLLPVLTLHFLVFIFSRQSDGFIGVRHLRQTARALECEASVFQLFLFTLQDDFDHMRPLCYPGTDVIMLCFSVVRPTSLCNVRDKWLPEIRKYMSKVPIVLVGTQTDLRSNVDVLVDLARYK